MPSFSIWGTDDEVTSIKAAAAEMERSVSWYLMWCHKQLKDASRAEVKKPPEVSKPKKKRVPVSGKDKPATQVAKPTKPAQKVKDWSNPLDNTPLAPKGEK